MPGVASPVISRTVEVVVGVDTHRDQHVAVAVDQQGVHLGEHRLPVTMCGYRELERWSLGLGQIRAFGIEGTVSYGAGVARSSRSTGRSGRSAIAREERSDRRGDGSSFRTCGCGRCNSEIRRELQAESEQTDRGNAVLGLTPDLSPTSLRNDIYAGHLLL